MIRILCLSTLWLGFFISQTKVHAWSGYDFNKGAFVEIEKGQLVREGEEIEFFDYDSGEYRQIEIESMDRLGNGVEITGIDSETGESRTFEMD